jgi:hypothetical protein
MFPDLFSIGPLTLHTYGLFVAVGFGAGIAITLRIGKDQGIPSQQVMDMAFIMILWAIVGSRLLYVVMNFPLFQGSSLGCGQGLAGRPGLFRRTSSRGARHGMVSAASSPIFLGRRRSLGPCPRPGTSLGSNRLLYGRVLFWESYGPALGSDFHPPPYAGAPEHSTSSYTVVFLPGRFRDFCGAHFSHGPGADFRDRSLSGT